MHALIALTRAPILRDFVLLWLLGLALTFARPITARQIITGLLFAVMLVAVLLRFAPL